MKNLATVYLDKTSKHLFTQDEKTFMKVLRVGHHAIQFKFGEKPSVHIIPNVGSYEIESPAGKVYLSPHLKWSIFPQWEEKYRSRKQWKKLQDLFDKVEKSFNPSLDYSNFEIRRNEQDRLREIISNWKFELRKAA